MFVYVDQINFSFVNRNDLHKTTYRPLLIDPLCVTRNRGDWMEPSQMHNLLDRD